LGGVEEHLKTQKAYRDENHPECAFLFFWMEEDSEIDHGGIRQASGTPISDFRWSWSHAVKRAHLANSNVREDLLFHDLRRSAVRVVIQEAGIPESQAMLISGHETRSMLERYNIVSLKTSRMLARNWMPGSGTARVANHLLPSRSFATSPKPMPTFWVGILRRILDFGGRGGGRTHTKSELRQILSLVRLPVPPLGLLLA
jgi:hypothetical protein